MRGTLRPAVGSVVLVLAAACHSGTTMGSGTDAGPDAASADAGQTDAPMSGVDAAPMEDAGSWIAPPRAECDPASDWQPCTFTGPDVFVARGAPSGGDGSEAHPYGDLQEAIDAAPDGATIHVGIGTFTATPTDYVDPTCGNCTDTMPATPAATRGFLIRGKSLAIVGQNAAETTLSTGAGYGVFIEDAAEVHLERLAITGGTRDPDGQASDAAVFVRRSRAVVRDVTIRGNQGLLPDGSYPGVAGIMCREGSDVLVMNATITNNSWDGISAYRQARARVFGSTISRGNGVGIGATFDSDVLAINNDISAYWKGIGAFVTAHVVARNNTIHGQFGWGMWAAQMGHLEATNNTIAYNDELGVYLADPNTTGSFKNNIVAFNGMNRLGGYTPDVFGQAGVRGPAGAAQPFDMAYDDIAANQAVEWVAADGATEIASSSWPPNMLTDDPGFVSSTDLGLAAASPLVHAGDPSILNADGTRSTVGATGGPDVGRTGP